MENNERLIVIGIIDENNNTNAKCCFFDTVEELIKEIDGYVANELKLQNVKIYIDEYNEIFLTMKGRF